VGMELDSPVMDFALLARSMGSPRRRSLAWKAWAMRSAAPSLLTNRVWSSDGGEAFVSSARNAAAKPLRRLLPCP